jgi:hypothetical protein
VCAILATLQYKGAKTKFVTLLAALQDLLRGKSVALGSAVAASKTAVKTVAAAEARQLYKAAYIYAKSELLARSSDGIIAK